MHDALKGGGQHGVGSGVGPSGSDHRPLGRLAPIARTLGTLLAANAFALVIVGLGWWPRGLRNRTVAKPHDGELVGLCSCCESAEPAAGASAGRGSLMGGDGLGCSP